MHIYPLLDWNSFMSSAVKQLWSSAHRQALKHRNLLDVRPFMSTFSCHWRLSHCVYTQAKFIPCIKCVVYPWEEPLSLVIGSHLYGIPRSGRYTFKQFRSLVRLYTNNVFMAWLSVYIQLQRCIYIAIDSKYPFEVGTAHHDDIAQSRGHIVLLTGIKWKTAEWKIGITKWDQNTHDKAKNRYFK